MILFFIYKKPLPRPGGGFMFLELNIYYDMKMPYIKANSHILTPFRRVLVNRLPFSIACRSRPLCERPSLFYTIY